MDDTPKFIVGLGNPGKQYERTRHNVGFMVLDELARHWDVEFKNEKAYKAHIAAAPGIVLIKPQTFMNESGVSVGGLARFFKMPAERILVVHDEVAFPLGIIKLRPGGGAGGHNGIKSIISHLGVQTFPRLRFGVGQPTGHKEMVGHVLGIFRPDEQELLNVMVAKTVDAIVYATANGLSAAANIYNVPIDSK